MEEEKEKGYVVQIDWVRHGLACHNVMRHYGGFLGGIKQKLLLDPELTDKGYEEAKKAGACLGGIRNEYDIVCASVMSRAIETAIGIFAGTGREINVIPYVNERGAGKENTSRDTLLDLERNIRMFQRKKRTNVRINYNFVDRAYFPTIFSKTRLRKTDIWEDTKKSSEEKFFKYIVPLLVKRIGVCRSTFELKIRDHESISIPLFRICIVSHGGFIREITKVNRFIRADGARKYKTSVLCHTPGSNEPDCCVENDRKISNRKTYKNPNTSVWRLFSLFYNERMIKRVKLYKIYTPTSGGAERGDGHGKLKRADVASCTEEVRRLIKE
ncbi:MAG: phosphoglycerate mutase family protein [Planctomycetota bacterium]|nr:phosphoglycerate mutase family protein [Planctomycetota bacterium]